MQSGLPWLTAPSKVASYISPVEFVIAPKFPHVNKVVLSVISVNDKLVSTPLPEGIYDPVNEKPIIVAPPVETLNPAFSDAPPEPIGARVNPVTSNWNPATGPSKSYNISRFPEGSKFPKLIVMFNSSSSTFTKIGIEVKSA